MSSLKKHATSLLTAQVRQSSEHEAEKQQANLRNAEAKHAHQLEGFAAKQKEEVAGLRVELRCALQEQALTMKGLGEQLWVIDEQLWQTDKKLSSRIDELSAMQAPSPSPLAHSGRPVHGSSLFGRSG